MELRPISLLLLGLALGSASTVSADATGDALASKVAVATKVGSDKPLGISTYRLKDEARLTGWQIGDRWFFGRQRGTNSNLGFVWQGDTNQFQIGREGVRWSRRF